MTSPTNLPQDIVNAYCTIKSLLLDLDDYTADEMKEWLSAVRDLIRQPTPPTENQFTALREWCNEITEENAYPNLF